MKLSQTPLRLKILFPIVASNGWMTQLGLVETFSAIDNDGRMGMVAGVGTVELEANYQSYGSPAIAHKRAEHSAHKPIDRINLRLVHHRLYCAT